MGTPLHCITPSRLCTEKTPEPFEKVPGFLLDSDPDDVLDLLGPGVRALDDGEAVGVPDFPAVAVEVMQDGVEAVLSHHLDTDAGVLDVRVEDRLLGAGGEGGVRRGLRELDEVVHSVVWVARGLPRWVCPYSSVCPGGRQGKLGSVAKLSQVPAGQGLATAGPQTGSCPAAQVMVQPIRSRAWALIWASRVGVIR